MMIEYRWSNMAGVQIDVVCNELLSYVQFYRNRATHDKVKKIVLNFFIPDEITSAKDVLWNYCAFMGDKPIRRDSYVRLKQDADFDDIISVFKKADEGNEKLPAFVALKLDRLPRYDPEEVNVFSLIDRLAVIEKELATVKQDVIDLKPAVHQQAPQQQQRGSFAEVAGRATATASVAGVGVGAADSHSKVQQPRHRPNDLSRDVSRKHPLPPGRGDDDFVTVKSRSNRRFTRRNRQIVVGTKSRMYTVAVVLRVNFLLVGYRRNIPNSMFGIWLLIQV